MKTCPFFNFSPWSSSPKLKSVAGEDEILTDVAAARKDFCRALPLTCSAWWTEAHRSASSPASCSLKQRPPTKRSSQDNQPTRTHSAAHKPSSYLVCPTLICRRHTFLIKELDLLNLTNWENLHVKLTESQPAICFWIQTRKSWIL